MRTSHLQDEAQGEVEIRSSEDSWEKPRADAGSLLFQRDTDRIYPGPVTDVSLSDDIRRAPEGHKVTYIVIDFHCIQENYSYFCTKLTELG